MSDYITRIDSDHELEKALATFSEVCAARAEELGLGPADLAEIEAAADGFAENLSLHVAAQAAAIGATIRKDDSKRASQEIVGKWAKVFRANTAIPDSTLGHLMVSPHRVPKVHTPPTAPTKLISKADGDGNITLQWDRNENRPGTTFEIESSASPTGEWRIIGTTTKIRFQMQAPVGQCLDLRVRASRASQKSPVSNPIFLWAANQNALKIAA